MGLASQARRVAAAIFLALCYSGSRESRGLPLAAASPLHGCSSDRSHGDLIHEELCSRKAPSLMQRDFGRSLTQVSEQAEDEMEQLSSISAGAAAVDDAAASTSATAAGADVGASDGSGVSAAARVAEATQVAQAAAAQAAEAAEVVEAAEAAEVGEGAAEMQVFRDVEVRAVEASRKAAAVAAEAAEEAESQGRLDLELQTTAQTVSEGGPLALETEAGAPARETEEDSAHSPASDPNVEVTEGIASERGISTSAADSTSSSRSSSRSGAVGDAGSPRDGATGRTATRGVLASAREQLNHVGDFDLSHNAQRALLLYSVGLSVIVGCWMYRDRAEKGKLLMAKELESLRTGDPLGYIFRSRLLTTSLTPVGTPACAG